MLAIALIPSVALLATGVTVVAVLGSDAVDARQWSTTVDSTIEPTVEFGTVVLRERTFSMRAVGGDDQAKAGLSAERDRTNAALQQLQTMTADLSEINADAMGKSLPIFLDLVARIPAIRQGVDIGSASAGEVDNYYSSLAQTVVIAMDGIAHATPEPVSAASGIIGSDIYYVIDLQSRVTGLAANGLAQGELGPADRLAIARVVGAYRDLLASIVPRLTDTVRMRYESLIRSDEWRAVTAAEDVLAERGQIPIGYAEWLEATGNVSAGLLGMWSAHSHYSEGLNKARAERLLNQTILVGSAVTLVAISAFVIAAWLAAVLVRRLRSLRTKAMELTDAKLASMVQRAHDGEPIDIDAEVSILDEVPDEIGEVAQAFHAAQRMAIEAATAEAKTRSGINKVFLDIAHRSQIVVHRQLDVLDIAESKQTDPEHLELLFKLDHLVTHSRRYAENLLLLGGRSPGRKWRTPVALDQVVRSAISETQDFVRVAAMRLPTALIQGRAVADLIHLLAELVDNATKFSPPDSHVSVRGNTVGRGVVIEVDDQGLGIPPAERERLNETLHSPPDFQAMAMAGQRHLGIFVVGQLAGRHGIAVSLRDSDYGGTTAIVLIPDSLITAELDSGADPIDASEDVVFAPRKHQRSSRAMESPPEQAPSQGDVAPYSPWLTETPDKYSTIVIPALAREFDELPGTRQGSRSALPPRRTPLPKRGRMENIVPQLRLDVESTPAAADVSPSTRSGEKARRNMASFQQGTREGRHSAME